jgi:hypothetical protein
MAESPFGQLNSAMFDQYQKALIQSKGILSPNRRNGRLRRGRTLSKTAFTKKPAFCAKAFKETQKRHEDEGASDHSIPRKKTSQSHRA